MRLRKLAQKVARRLGWLPHHSRPDGPVAPGLDLRFLRQRESRGKGNPPALRRPPTVPVQALELPGEELVLGVEHGGEARAYPISTLWPHHLVNDVLGGIPILVSFCQKCFSGMSFDPVVEGRVLEFDVYGRYMGALVVRDDQTRTLWAHLTGEALAGPMLGQTLTMLPVEVTTLSRWTESHPESSTPDPRLLVAPRPVRPGSRASGGGIGTVPHRDGRLPSGAWVLGVRVDGQARAYQVDPDRAGPRFHQDQVGDVPVVLLAPSGGWPLIYDRRTAAGVVELRPEGQGLVDATGTTWTDGGRAVDGPQAGSSLSVIPSRIVEWFAWNAYNPDTDVFRPLDETDRAGASEVRGT